MDIRDQLRAGPLGRAGFMRATTSSSWLVGAMVPVVIARLAIHISALTCVGRVFGPYGGFAEFIPVPARYLIKVDRRLKFDELAPLTDAGLTPYRGVKKLRDAGALGPNRVLGVFGVGGLGGYTGPVCQAPWGGAKIVAFDRNPDNLAVAKEYRTDHIISIKGKPSADISKELRKVDDCDRTALYSRCRDVIFAG